MTNSADILLLVSDPLDAEISIRRDLLALQDALVELECAVNFHLRAAEADDTQKYLDGGDRPGFSVKSAIHRRKGLKGFSDRSKRKSARKNSANWFRRCNPTPKPCDWPAWPWFSRRSVTMK
ncbi:MAG: hypothetical protein AB7P14_25575 [Blastocatellales bacterium]